MVQGGGFLFPGNVEARNTASGLSSWGKLRVRGSCKWKDQPGKQLVIVEDEPQLLLPSV